MVTQGEHQKSCVVLQEDLNQPAASVCAREMSLQDLNLLCIILTVPLFSLLLHVETQYPTLDSTCAHA